MAKLILRESKPDDPWFLNGSEVYVPLSRPSAASSMPDTAGDQAASSPQPQPQPQQQPPQRPQM
jgi:hypothetical protein